MNDFMWSVEIAVLGMGTVFAMLIVLMIGLLLMSRADAKPKAAEQIASAGDEDDSLADSPAPVITFSDPSGLSRDQIAAISIAVITHAGVRRKQGAPVNREHQPGSRLWASRWVAIGRNAQMHNTRRK